MTELNEPWTGATTQYLTAARALWDLFADTASIADPSTKARAFGDGLSKLQQDMQATWLANLSGGALGFMHSMPGRGGAQLGGVAPSFEWPALGLTRERQEAMQRLNKLMQDYWQAQARLSMQWAEVLRTAFVMLGERVGAKLGTGEALTSPKALYDLWIEAAEAAFAKMAHGADYARTQGELANALSALRTEQRKLFESFSRELDLPTRDELNSVHRRLKELKAELRAFEAALAGERPASRAAATATPDKNTNDKNVKRARRKRSNGR
jgi:polyhydroxyalkanoate synthase subunit PhaE